MKRIVLMFCFLFLCSFCLNAKDPLLITLKLIPEEQVLGCPVKAIVEVKNEGKEAVKVPPFSQHRYVFTLKCDCNEGIYFNKKGTFEGQVKWELLEGGKEKVYEIEEFLWPYPKKAGSYKIYAEYDPFAYQMVSEEERRESIILSDRVSLSVKAPTGIDLEAYNYFKAEPLSKPQELLQKFPTSTYAGYVIYERFAGSIPGARNPNTAAIEEDAKKYALSLISPRADEKIYKASDSVIRENISMIESVLNSHPDFIYRYGLQFYEGIQYLQIKEFPLAVQCFKKCVEASAPELICKTAQIYLDVLKDNGLIKEEEVKTKEVDRK